MNDALPCVRHRIGTDIDCLASSLPVPGLGAVPVNAYVIHATEPVLVDTGMRASRDELLKRLEESLDPEDLRWIWMTHADPDHTGSLEAILEMAPEARVVTTFLGLAKLTLLGFDVGARAYLLNPGQALDVGNRRLVALRPPTYDAPETTALLDTHTRALLSADFFGAVLDGPFAAAEDVPEERLGDGMRLWATIDAPWLPMVDRARFVAALEEVRKLAPSMVLGSHLPPAHRLFDTLLANVKTACDAPPFVGPDQAAFEASMPKPPERHEPKPPRRVSARRPGA